MERMNLLICDLDGTLLGDDRALDEFAQWYSAASEHFRLVYSSGRFIGSVQDSIDDSGLPEPDAIIGGLGTEIYDVSAARRAFIWPPSAIGWNPYVIRMICDLRFELTPQPDHFDSYYKISYYGVDLDERFLENLVRHLASAGQDVTVVYSSNRDLDVMPAGVDKGSAATFMARYWKVDPLRVIVAGDSGNDAAMFRAGFRGIVVGNAHLELRRMKGPLTYHATAEYAAGVLEGLNYWLPRQSAGATHKEDTVSFLL